MHLEEDKELAYSKQEMAQAVQETWHQKTTYSDPLHLQANVYPVQRRDKAIYGKRNLDIFHGLENSTTTALQER